MILVVVGDLASVAADAVVRPADTSLAPVGPALRLDEAAGPSFVEQRRLSHELGPGAAVVTGAGDLLAEFVVHTVIGSTAETLRRSIEAALWQCAQWHIRTLALPGLMAPDDMTAIVGALQGPMRNADYPATVLIVTGTPEDRDRYQARLGPSEDR